MNKLEIFEKKQIADTKLPEFKVGDTVRVYVKIPEADKIRIHPFEGTVIRKRGSGIRTTFTVRKISFGEGIERVFPAVSSSIDKVEVLRSTKIRRAKLYYLRNKIGKGAKLESQDAQETAK
ncbi:MAG: 50S ribosomal protein L19 [Candidatus Omnitrophota bacterium]